MTKGEQVATGLIALIPIGLIGFMAFAGGRVSDRTEVNRARRFDAPSYAWTPSCPRASRSEATAMPQGCARKVHRLKGVWKLGLYGGRGHDWYRVGDDAVDLDCPAFGDGDCRVREIAADKFRAVSTLRKRT